MGAGRFVGRVGALAVALGVGAAVSSGTAWADDAAGGSPNSAGAASGSNDSGGATSGSNAASGSDAGGGTADSTSVSDSAAGSSEEDASDGTPSSVDESTEQDPDETAADPDASTDSPAEVRDDSTEQEDTSPAPTRTSTDESSASRDRTERSSDAAEVAEPTAVEADRSSARSSTASETESDSSIADGETTSVAAAVAEPKTVVVDTITPTPLAAPVTDTADTVAAAADSADEPTASTAQLAGAVAASLLGTGAPGDVPVDTPAEWVLLAAARRELADPEDSSDQTATGSVATLALPTAAAPDPVGDILTGAFQTITGILSTAVSVADGTITGALNLIGGTINLAATATTMVLNTAINVVNWGITTTANLITGALATAVNALADAFDSSPTPLGDAIAGTLTFLNNVVTTTVNVLTQASTDVLSFTAAGLSTAVTLLSDTVVGTLNLATQAVDLALQTINTILNPNSAPVAADDVASTAEDAAVLIAAATLLANDTDPDDDVLSISALTQGTYGSTSRAANGDITYNPGLNFNGTDTFTYTVTDGTKTSTATVTVTVTPVNDAPVAGNDTATTAEESPLTIAPATLLANDTDPEGDTVSITAVGQGVHGTTGRAANGDITYTPGLNFSGTDTFSYTVSDGTLSSTATVTVTVTPVNDAPLAGNDTTTTAEDTSKTIAANTLLANDSDPDHDALSITAAGQGVHGTTSKAANGDITYTPNANFNGTDTFTYTISDGSKTATATVTVTVTPVNDAPVGVNDTASTTQGLAVTLAANTLLANDSDVDTAHTALSITAATQGAHGTTSRAANGDITYTPNSTFAGTDTFTYTVSDGTLTNTATVTVTVTGTTPVEHAPVANNDTTTTDEDTPKTITANTLLANDSDADNDPLTITAATQGAHGTTSKAANGDITYTPNTNFNGTDTFTYTLTDGTLTNTATVTVTITPVNDAPVGVGDSASTTQGLAVTLAANTLLANDSDADNDPLTITAATQGAHGTTSRAANGDITYTPNTNFNGTDTFTYTVSDGSLSSSATVNVTITPVTPVNGAPVIGAVDSVPGIGNTWTVKVSPSDPDNDPVTVTLTAVDTTHVTVTKTGTANTYTVTVTDTHWAAAHPAAQVYVSTTAGDGHTATTTTVAIGTVNNALAIGSLNEQTDIPALPGGVIYTQVAASGYHTVLLRSDGTAIATGNDDNGQTDIPDLPTGVTYTAVAASGDHTVLLRSDGTAIAVGNDDNGQTDIPDLPTGLSYTAVAAGNYYTVLLHSDGTAIAIGYNSIGQTDIPDLPTGVTYTAVAAADDHTVLLRSDGTAIAIGDYGYGQLDIPDLPTGVTYTAVAAGADHTVLLRSDGTAIATGYDYYRQTDIPDLPTGVTYTAVAAGGYHTVLLRSDGTAIAIGADYYGQTPNIPALPDGVRYIHVASTGLLTAVSAAAAIDDTLSTKLNTPLVIDPAALLGNDSAGDADSLTISAVGQGLHGSITTNDNGTITYTPNADYTGQDSFTYTVTDGVVNYLAAVTVTIPHVTVLVTSDTPDPDTGTVTGTITAPSSVSLASQAARGTAVVNEDGTFTYTPTLIERLRAATNPTNDTFTVRVAGVIFAVDVAVSPARYAATDLINIGDPTGQKLNQPAFVGYANGRAFVADATAGQVQAVDLATSDPVGTPITVADPLAVLGVGNRVYIGASSSAQIVVVDATTLATVGTIALKDNSGGTLDGVAGDPNRIAVYGTKLVVTSHSTNALFVVNPTTSDVTAIALPTPSRGMAIIGDTAYVLAPPPSTSSTRSTAYAVNLTTGGIDTLDVGYGAADITAAGGKLYVANYTTDTVTVINNDTITDTINIADGPFSITTSPDGTHVVVVSVAADDDSADGGVATVIDTNTKGYPVLGSFTVPQGSYLASFSPDGQIYISSAITDDVYVARVVVDSNLPPVSRTTSSSILNASLGLPAGVALSPDGTRAYVTNTADLDGNAGNTVLVIDTASNEAIGDPITVGSTPGALTVSPDGAHVYVVNGDGTVSVIDTATNTVQSITVSTELSGGIAVNPDGTRVYVADAANDLVAVINTATNTVTGIPVGYSPSDVAVNSDGTRVYVTNAGDASVSVIDTVHNTVSTIDIPGGPLLGNIAISPDDHTLYVTAPGDYQLIVINTSTRTVTATVPLGAIAPGDVTFSPDGSYALVAGGDALAVIDTATNTVARNIPAGGTGISAIAFADDGTAYVTTLFNDSLDPDGKLTTISFASPNAVSAMASKALNDKFTTLNVIPVATYASLADVEHPATLEDLMADQNVSILDYQWSYLPNYWRDLGFYENEQRIRGVYQSQYYDFHGPGSLASSYIYVDTQRYTARTPLISEPGDEEYEYLSSFDYYVVKTMRDIEKWEPGVNDDASQQIIGLSPLPFYGGTVTLELTTAAFGLTYWTADYHTYIEPGYYSYSMTAYIIQVPKGYVPDALENIQSPENIPIPDPSDIPDQSDNPDDTPDPNNGPIEKKWEDFKKKTGWIPIVGQVEAAISLGFDDVQLTKDLFTGNLDDARDERADILWDAFGIVNKGKVAGKVVTRVPGGSDLLIGKDLSAAANESSTLDGTALSKIGGLI